MKIVYRRFSTFSPNSCSSSMLFQRASCSSSTFCIVHRIRCIHYRLKPACGKFKYVYDISYSVHETCLDASVRGLRACLILLPCLSSTLSNVLNASTLPCSDCTWAAESLSNTHACIGHNYTNMNRKLDNLRAPLLGTPHVLRRSVCRSTWKRYQSPPFKHHALKTTRTPFPPAPPPTPAPSPAHHTQIQPT